MKMKSRFQIIFLAGYAKCCTGVSHVKRATQFMYCVLLSHIRKVWLRRPTCRSEKENSNTAVWVQEETQTHLQDGTIYCSVTLPLTRLREEHVAPSTVVNVMGNNRAAKSTFFLDSSMPCIINDGCSHRTTPTSPTSSVFTSDLMEVGVS